MNYEKIHDSIINRAINRPLQENTYYENHHIIPKCEGGDPNGTTVSLTLKEHRIVHKLRYKFTNVIGNICAYNMMKNGEFGRIKNAKLAAKHSHEKLKKRDPERYSKKQSIAGKSGGKNAFLFKKGFHAIPETEMQKIRLKGTKTLVDNKIGMFSDEYRKIHKEKMKKKICIENLQFDSCTDAARHYNVVNGTISYWLKTGKAEIIYEGEYSFKGKVV